MKVYVINLKKDIDRKIHIKGEFERIGFTNYEFFEAFNASELSRNTLKRISSKSMTVGEIGCAMSHRMICEKIIDEQERVLILEDDIVFNDNIKNVLGYVIEQNLNNNDNNIVFFGGHGSENNVTKHANNDIHHVKEYFAHHKSTHRQILLDKHIKITVNDVEFYKLSDEYIKKFDIYGTYGYSPSKKFCEIMIKENSPIKYKSDEIWNKHHESDLYFPMLPDHRMFVDATVEFGSNVSFHRKNIGYDRLFHKTVF